MIKASFTFMALAVSPAASLCPFGFGSDTKLPAGHPTISPPLIPPTEPSAEYTAAMHELDIGAVQEDLKKLMTDSQDWWPADYGNYGPFFIRLAWHCSGSYRETDGRGGCSGGRQRFDPERSWEDNTNLDKARRLLWPIKEKYGLGLSWGDLFVMAGTTAIESMGGPTLGVCVGRVDDEDGSRSQGLMPSDAHPCTKDGDCEKPMGATTVGLIYVNPEGPMGNPIPDQSALQIRDTFARMGMNDEETVALIGGGHTFGKAHGACDKGAGLSPAETEAAGGNGDTEAWQGNCGTGKGKDTFTSGFEGAWTTNPTKWDNSYFRNLLQWKWDVHKGPGGHYQWKVDSAYPPQAPDAHVEGANQDIMMFTSDMALLEDPANKYQALVKEFASNPAKLDEVFAKAWHKLTTRAFGAQKAPRCVTKSKQGKSWATKATLRTGATCSA